MRLLQKKLNDIKIKLVKNLEELLLPIKKFYIKLFSYPENVALFDVDISEYWKAIKKLEEEKYNYRNKSLDKIFGDFKKVKSKYETFSGTNLVISDKLFKKIKNEVKYHYTNTYDLLNKLEKQKKKMIRKEVLRVYLFEIKKLRNEKVSNVIDDDKFYKSIGFLKYLKELELQKGVMIWV